MKAFLQALIVLLPFTATAQNWGLFNSHDHYDFKQATAPLINSICFADSFQVSGSDTLYFVNRIVERNNLNNTSNYDTAQLNRWQFLQREIWRKANGWYVFFNPGSLTLNANAGLGDQWLYDTARNISITVIKADTATQFGVIDSLKYFALSDSSDTIIISRSFGILRFPTDTADRLQQYTGSFFLQGIETRNVGERPINFWDIYNFNVGDIFVYSAAYYEPGGWNGNWVKYTILSKSVTADSVSYMERFVNQSFNILPVNDPPVTDAGIGSLIFKDSATHIANTYPGQFLDYTVYDFSDPASGYFTEPGYTFSSYVKDTTLYHNGFVQSSTYGVPCKKAGINNYLGMYDLIQNNQMLSTQGGRGDEYYCVICEGLGHVHYGIDGFEDEYYFELTGYEKNGITYGTVPTDEEMGLTGIQEVSQGPILRVYPNIVKDILLVSLSNASSAAYYFNLYDLTGRQVMSQSLAVGNTEVLCSKLSPAMYIWKACDNNGNVLGSGKIIKQ